jgi:hypothetical protein
LEKRINEIKQMEDWQYVRSITSPEDEVKARPYDLDEYVRNLHDQKSMNLLESIAKCLDEFEDGKGKRFLSHTGMTLSPVISQGSGTMAYRRKYQLMLDNLNHFARNLLAIIDELRE